MSEWKEVTLKYVIEYANTGLDAIKRAPIVLENTGIKCLRIQDISQNKPYSEWGFTNVEQKNYEKFRLRKGDIIIARTGNTIGVNRFFNEDLASVFNNGLIRLRVKKDGVNPKYIFYNLRSKYFRDFIESISGGTSTQPNMQIEVLLGLDILLPPLPEQERIAEVLSSLDDKIDLLHRQNKTLEEMAETLFRKWFLEETEENMNNFKIKDLDIYITDFVANGSFESLKNNVTLINDKIDYALFIRNTDLKSGFKNRVYVNQSSYNFLSKSKLYGGEIIISNVADVGSVHICPQFEIPMTLGNNVIMLRSKYNLFLYHYFKSSYGQSQIQGITSGSAQQKFNKTDFRALEIVISTEDDLLNFHNAVQEFHKKIDINNLQIQQLETLRDTLLPKLMSGKVTF